MITNSVFDVILVSVGHVHQPVEFEVRPSLGFRFAACSLWWPSFRCDASDAGGPALTLKHDFVWCYWFFLSVLLIDWPHVQPCRWLSSGFVVNLWASSRPVLQESVANVQPHLGRPFFHGKIGCIFFWIVSVKLNLKPETIHAFANLS